MSDDFTRSTTHQNTIQEHWLSLDMAVREVVAFEKKFGQQHLLLACHAALPLIVTAEMLNLIHYNFLDHEAIPWFAEADFLLSPLCRQVNNVLFEVEPRIREVLLTILEERFGRARLIDIADFLLVYLRKQQELQPYNATSTTIRWIALSYFAPDEAVTEMSSFLQSSISPKSQQGADVQGQLLLTTTIEIVAEPLERTSLRQEYQTLVSDSRVLAEILYNDDADVEAELIQHYIDENYGKRGIVLLSSAMQQWLLQEHEAADMQNVVLDVSSTQQEINQYNDLMSILDIDLSDDVKMPPAKLLESKMQQLKKSIMYVNYESLLVGLSHVQYAKVAMLLTSLLEKARQRFHILQAIVLGNWTPPMSRRLTERGFLCQPAANEVEAKQIIERSIAQQLAKNAESDVYILVGGQIDYLELLQQLYQSGKESIMWAFVPPPANNQELCTEWELIPTPEVSESTPWPRQVMLQAIAIVTDHLHQVTGSILTYTQLRDRLNQIWPFHRIVPFWLSTAIKEQIIVLQQPATEQELISLNRQHHIVQKALRIRERILSTLSVMLTNREWVAFRPLERALHTAKLLASDQRTRQAWLELFIAEGICVAEQIPQPEGLFQVTVLHLNASHPIIVTLPLLHQRNLVRLIVLMSGFTIEKKSGWIAISRLLSILTTETTRVEARATLSEAEQQGIVKISTIPSFRNQTFPVSTAELQAHHPLVRDTLAMCEQLLALTRTVVANSELGVSETSLAEEFERTKQMQREEALFWIELLIKEGSLKTERIMLAANNFVTVIRFTDQEATTDSHNNAK